MSQTHRLKRLALKLDAGETVSEAEQRAAFGWAHCLFVDARVDVLRERLSPQNVAKLDAMPYHRKVKTVEKLVLKGAMI